MEGNRCISPHQARVSTSTLLIEAQIGGGQGEGGGVGVLERGREGSFVLLHLWHAVADTLLL